MPMLFALILMGATEPAHGQSVKQLEAVNLSLHTGNPITVVGKGGEKDLYFKATNPKQAEPVRFRLQLEVTDYFGRKFVKMLGPVSVEPGTSAKIPLGAALPAVGWWHVQPTLLSADGKAKVSKSARQLVYLEPLRTRDLPPTDDFWFGLDSRVRSPEMLRLFSRMGVDILRFGTWSRVNPENGKYDFESFDKVVDGIRAEGMQALYSVTFTPAFAVDPKYRGKGDPSRLPPQPEKLQAALQKIIAHTKSKGLLVYDLWNEPDHRGFWRGNTKDYLDFMCVAYQTIKTVQPQATVLSGGIASFHQGTTDKLNPDMDRRIVIDGRKWYDALALHEHGPFERFADALDGQFTEYRKQLKEEVPLWLTETGSNGDVHVAAADLVKKVVFARTHNAKGFILYALYPPGQGGGYNIIDKQGDPKPTVAAYVQMVRMMRGKRFLRAYEDSTNTGNRLFSFADQEQTLFIAWGKGATAYRAPIRLTKNAEVQAFDLMGRSLKLERSGDIVYLPFSRSPSYLQIRDKANVEDYEKITPLALFEFGSLKPSPGNTRVRVSPLQPKGWKRHNPDDRDKRMAKSTSGPPNGLFDSDGKNLSLQFTITPTENTAIDLQEFSFWGNAGAFSDTKVELSYQVGDKAPIAVGERTLRNLSTPRTNGEHHSFLLSGLEGIRSPITFTLTANRNGERVIFKIDDLRVDGLICKD